MADGAPSHDEPMRARALEDLDMELVISRLNEPLDWLAKVPAFYKVTIYNKVDMQMTPDSAVLFQEGKQAFIAPISLPKCAGRCKASPASKAKELGTGEGLQSLHPPQGRWRG